VVLGNRQSSAVTPGTQISVDVDWSSFRSVVAPNLQNVQFLDSSNNSIPAWLESCDGSELTCDSASNSSIVWVKLDQGIQSSGQAMIFLSFGPVSTNYLSSTGDWGESPQLSPSYAEFDNGAKVFNFYDDFAGSSLDSQWAVGTGDNPITVDNGLTVGPSLGYNGATALSTIQSFGQGTIDFYGLIPEATPAGSTYTYGGVGIGTRGSDNGCCYFDNSTLIGVYGGTYGLETGSSDGLEYGAGTIVAGLSFGNDSVYTILIPSSTPAIITAQVNYGQNVSASIGLPLLPQPISIFDQNSTGISIGPLHWIRERTYIGAGEITATFSNSTG
jgi:hypothetical protein